MKLLNKGKEWPPRKQWFLILFYCYRYSTMQKYRVDFCCLFGVGFGGVSWLANSYFSQPIVEYYITKMWNSNRKFSHKSHAYQGFSKIQFYEIELVYKMYL